MTARDYYSAQPLPKINPDGTVSTVGPNGRPAARQDGSGASASSDPTHAPANADPSTGAGGDSTQLVVPHAASSGGALAAASERVHVQFQVPEYVTR